MSVSPLALRSTRTRRDLPLTSSDLRVTLLLDSKNNGRSLWLAPPQITVAVGNRVSWGSINNKKLQPASFSRFFDSGDPLYERLLKKARIVKLDQDGSECLSSMDFRRG
jgi:hypothetical protein